MGLPFSAGRLPVLLVAISIILIRKRKTGIQHTTKIVRLEKTVMCHAFYNMRFLHVRQVENYLYSSSARDPGSRANF